MAGQKIIRRMICGVLAVLLLWPSGAGAEWGMFTDISGHWAEEAIRRAYDDGLLDGYPDGTLRPDGAVTGAEVLALLTRVLDTGAQADLSDTEIGPDKWYYAVAARALALGLVGPGELGGLEEPMTRQEVFILVARAFQLVPAEQDLTPLEQFADRGDLSYPAMAPASSLVERGYVQGDGEGLNPEGGITRGELVTILGRIVGNRLAPEEVGETVTGGISVPGHGSGPTGEGATDVTLAEVTLNTDVLISGTAERVTLEEVETDHSILVRSDRLEELNVLGGHVGRLTLAAVSGDLTLAPDGGRIDTVVVGTGGGAVRLDGEIGRVEVTGDNRLVYLDMEELEGLYISGSGNRVVTAPGAQIGEIRILYGGEDNHLSLPGQAGRLEVLGDRTTVAGGGAADHVLVRGVGCDVAVYGESRVDAPDYGLTGVGITLTPTADPVPPGGELRVDAAFTGVAGEAVVAAQWYLDGQPVPEYGNDSFDLSPHRTSAYSPPIVFEEDMGESITVALELTYNRMGEPQRVYGEIRVEIENYPDEYYHPGPSADDKLIALTFDDGPGRYTEWLLDELAKRDVSVTFFVLGSCVKDYPHLVKRMAEEGHEIGSHSYGHPNMTALGREDMLRQLNWTKGAIYDAAGVVPQVFRPPYGNHNQTLRNVCAEQGLSLILWSVDTEDWKSRNVSSILGRMRVRDGDIVLMHDIYQPTVQAAITTVDRLLAEGYTFVTVSQLLELRGGAQPGAVYRERHR